MTHCLNLTLPIKQDAETQAKLQRLADEFPTKIQPAIERVLKKSSIVHFARVLVIDNKYIQVITAYDGDHEHYTEFFRMELRPIFAAIFDLVEGAPDVNDRKAFLEFAKKHNVRALGAATDNSKDLSGNPAGWLFSAYGHKDVRTIQAALEKKSDHT